MKASRIDKLMFELHQKKNLPEKKANRINKLMYGLHQRKDPKKQTAYRPQKNHLLSAFRLINTEFTHHPTTWSPMPEIYHKKGYVLC